jgi:pyruvate/2-oxoglutarate dehydrogenase complex dihydrolipoamide dehydrogenase (E3) component
VGELVDGGLRVALVERELVGGQCSYYACIPSKTLLHRAREVDDLGDQHHRRDPAAVAAGLTALRHDHVGAGLQPEPSDRTARRPA